MAGFLKRLFPAGPRHEFTDDQLGLFLSEHRGVWLSEMPFQGHQIQILLYGTKHQPNIERLALARKVVPELAARVNQALIFAVAQRPELGPDRLKFAGLNLCYEKIPDGFLLDFIEIGDTSRNCWQVHFEAGEPVCLEYT